MNSITDTMDITQENCVKPSEKKQGRVRIRLRKNPLSCQYSNKSPLGLNSGFQGGKNSLKKGKTTPKYPLLPDEVYGYFKRIEKLSRKLSGGTHSTTPEMQKIGKKRRNSQFINGLEIYEVSSTSSRRYKPVKYDHKKEAMREPSSVTWCKQECRCLRLEKESTGEAWYQRYKCRTWRHEGDCARWKGRQDFTRIKKAIESLGEEWVYVVLTFDREKDLYDAYKGIIHAWDKLRKRLQREYGEIKYITLIEQHKDQFPHVNVLIHNKKLYSACEEAYEVTPLKELFREDSLPSSEATIYGWRWERVRWWQKAVEDCGFGRIFWLEPMRSKEAIAGYFVKLVGEMAGELTKSSKQSQNPVSAPKNFRRLRASRGVLEPILRDPDITGELLSISLEEAIEDGLREGTIEEEDIEPDWSEKLTQQKRKKKPNLEEWEEDRREREAIQEEDFEIEEEEIPF